MPPLCGQDLPQQIADHFPPLRIARRRLDDDRLSEQVVDHRVHPPADVVLDHDFLARDIIQRHGAQHVAPAAHPRDPRGQVPIPAPAGKADRDRCRRHRQPASDCENTPTIADTSADPTPAADPPSRRCRPPMETHLHLRRCRLVVWLICAPSSARLFVGSPDASLHLLPPRCRFVRTNAQRTVGRCADSQAK